MALRLLHDNWTLTPVSGSIPQEIAHAAVPATVPGCVHTDLHRAGLIDAPFDGDNESAQQWIGSSVWRYETDFEWHDDGSDRHDLVADGLDTVAVIEVNGRRVAETQNQHRGYRFDLGEHLRDGTNTLAITFRAPVDEAESRSAEHGPRPHVNHHPYNALRKAAFNFGWDWGIDVATSGIWRSIGLDSWSGVRIAAVRPLVDLVRGEGRVDGVLDAHIDLEWSQVSTGEPVLVTATIGGVSVSERVAQGTTEVVLRATVPDARVWWPTGHGDQPLYPVDIALERAGEDVDHWGSTVGFRTVRVDTAPDAEGRPFALFVNDEPIQVRGANWIPDHAFVTEIDADRYRRRVGDAVEANMNLLRVWGGGIYESDDFYAACDEAGILVWQDFLFACAAYAEEEWLADEVEAEARQAITRLSPHPSLVIWNGNNENIWGHEDWGWKEPLDGRTWGLGYYLSLLPALVAELDPTRFYSPASPYSFDERLHPNDESNGTMHIWDVWNTLDYSEYRRHRPRFASEFGFQGPPAWTTLVDAVHDDPLDPYGRQMLVHQKAADGNLKLERGMTGHLPEPRTIEEWHWATQLNQAAAVRFGIEHFRSLSPRNTGVIVWQLNDSWPVVSWAAVDFAERRKPLWFALRDVYEPRLATFQPRESGLSLVVLNDTGVPWRGEVVLQRTTFDGQVLAESVLSQSVPARGEATIGLDPDLTDFADAAEEIVIARLDGFATAVHNPVELVAQRLDPDGLDVDVREADDESGAMIVHVTARAYVRDITLLVDRYAPAATVDRGLVTLLAGETAEFRVGGGAGGDAAALKSPAVLQHGNALLRGRSLAL